MPSQAPSDACSQDSPRQRLIHAAVAHGAANGLADTSLRQLAAALGTSHRMLIHHFGSKEGLLVEVVRAVEHRQRALLTELVEQPGSPDLAGREFWDTLNDPDVRRHERLFFEVYGQALQGRSWALPLLDGIVSDWVTPLAEMLEARGQPAEEARVDARLAVAVSRGLLLDVLATGDQAEVDAAQVRFLQLLADGTHHAAPDSAPTPSAGSPDP
jgi:AcrR family transcriptional regulator